MSVGLLWYEKCNNWLMASAVNYIKTFIKSIFIMMIFSSLGTKLTHAQELTCPQLLSNRSVALSQEVTRPKLGNRINPEGLRAWVEAHRVFGPEFYELAQFIAENIVIKTQEEFEAYLLSALNTFLGTLFENQNYFIVVTEGTNKSQYWVSRIITEIASKKAPISTLVEPSEEEFEQHLEEHPEAVPLFLDDAAYTGQSIEEGIRSYIPESYRLNDEINIILAATTKYAKETLERNRNFKVFFGLMMPSIDELLNAITDIERRNRLIQVFEQQYSEFSLDLPITGFAHKTADMASIPGMSSEEDYLYVTPQEPGTTILEGVLLGPDQRVRATIPILHVEEKPY